MSDRLQFTTLKNPIRTDEEYTIGATINPAMHNDGLTRFFLFEWDKEHFTEDTANQIQQIVNEIDVPCWVHATGNGIHLISLVPILKSNWKKTHEKYRHINPKCPMTTLRMMPNKYRGENMIWLLSSYMFKPKTKDTVEVIQLEPHETMDIIMNIAQTHQLVKYKFKK